MRVVLADPLAYSETFTSAFHRACPDADFMRWDRIEPGQDYEVLVTWALPPELKRFPPSIRAVFCFAAGADQLIDDPRLPGDLPVVRLQDPGQAAQLLDYAMHAAFARLQDDMRVRLDQRQRNWQKPEPGYRSRASLRISVLGLGAIGAYVAAGLAASGFTLSGWSRQPRRIVGVMTYAGEAGLGPCVDDADLLINILPSTETTRRVLCAPLFDRMAKGGYLVNVGRGDQLDEASLKRALDMGRLDAAWLDVFSVEPLPRSHWLWTHEKVRVTPHCAGLPTPGGSATSIAAVVEALRDNRDLPGRVERRE